MNTYSHSTLKTALQNQLRRLSRKLEGLEKLSNRLSFTRLATFIVGLLLIYVAGTWGPEWIFWLSIVAFIGVFVQLVRYHRKIDRIKEKFTRWKSIRQTHLARQQLDWTKIPQKKLSDNYSNHPFATDLDITGDRSLLQLLDTSSYQGSADQLGDYLLNENPDPKIIHERRRVVEELSGKPQFRDTLQMLCGANHQQKMEEDWSMEQLLAHLESSEPVDYTSTLFILGGLACLNILLGVLYAAGVIAPYVVFTLVVYLLIYNFNSGKADGLYDEAHQIEKLLRSFQEPLQFLEGYDYQSTPALKKFCNPFRAASYSPSDYIKRILRIAVAASSQQNEFLWLFLNLLVPWDIYFAQKLSSYKKELAPPLRGWISRFYRLEALSSMANFAWLNPSYIFSTPDIHADKPFKARNMGHPLIPEDENVTNNFSIAQKGDLLLLTGSNMAGKSTFLRTLGINLALCFAGAPVNAFSFSTIPFRIFSSINITDSLEGGLSHFYAEVKRLKKLMLLLNDNHQTPLFFLVDEIYRGTNNRERLQGSRAFLKNVADKNGVGIVSTHDLELAQLEESIPQLSNAHFEETIADGKMSFEYKLKPGPCSSTNALQIMKMEGLPT